MESGTSAWKVPLEFNALAVSLYGFAGSSRNVTSFR
jgi:hypothetical protein